MNTNTIRTALKKAEAQLKAEGFYRVCSVLAGPQRSGIIFSNGSERRRVTFDQSTNEAVIHTD